MIGIIIIIMNVGRKNHELLPRELLLLFILLELFSLHWYFVVLITLCMRRPSQSHSIRSHNNINAGVCGFLQDFSMS